MIVRPETEANLIRLLQSGYLRDEARYDKWGALGKVLLVQTILQNYEIRSLPAPSLIHIINQAFPRTFVQDVCPLLPSHRESVREYYHDIRESFIIEGMDQKYASDIASEETAEKFHALTSDILGALG